MLKCAVDPCFLMEIVIIRLSSSISYRVSTVWWLFQSYVIFRTISLWGRTAGRTTLRPHLLPYCHTTHLPILRVPWSYIADPFNFNVVVVSYVYLLNILCHETSPLWTHTQYVIDIIIICVMFDIFYRYDDSIKTVSASELITLLRFDAP